ncbi:MAG: 16S rRNA (cytidine(1402)-2'-O)-methyltransferase [Lachnospiraceae bacterium]|nr:16S rRNA (cytidine(1402)-2'-O)-methyltransferase [Lachnospiraceae bacterium]
MDTEKTGKLYLCPTPIGNLGDMSFRAVETLGAVDLIAAEDTRNSIKILNHFDIHVPMTSYHEHNKYEKAEYLVKQILGGKSVAVITDAGTPGISDPGEELVAACIKAGIEVTSLPGATAAVTALTISGLSTRRFCFEGFLPVDKKERETVLARLTAETRTTVFYEAPHRLLKTLELLIEAAGEDRRAAVCKELTKKHEAVFRGTLGEALRYFTENEPRGEFVIVIEGADPESLVAAEREQWNEVSIEDHVKRYEDQGYSRKDAMKMAAADRGVAKRDIYKYLAEMKED